MALGLLAYSHPHRVEAVWLAITVWAFGLLGESEKPKGPGSEARGRGRLGALTKKKPRCQG